MKRFLVILSVACQFSTTTWAAVPASITVQGKLTDASGIPLPAGSKSFVFRIFDAQTLGTQVWPGGGVGENQSLTTDAAGLWIGLVGATSPLNDAVFSGTGRWLQITVDGTTLPRTRLNTAPYAYRLSTVDGATGGQISGQLHVNGGLRWGGGLSAPYSRSDLDAGGLFVEHLGSNASNDNLRFQTSTSGDAANYCQFIIDPSSGFSFAAIGAGNGNVGIGTSTPNSKLEVRGDVRLGASGEYLAASGHENLRILFGFIGPDGQILEGSAFEITRVETGYYQIYFETPSFSGVPAVTVTTNSGYALVSGQAQGSCLVRTYNSLSAPIDSYFNIIVVGPR